MPKQFLKCVKEKKTSSGWTPGAETCPESYFLQTSASVEAKAPKQPNRRTWK